ncbi:HGGxSTG domain-containing protein [Rhodanobacter thiooxydans]
MPCRAVGLDNGRCKWHGGKSTGPVTEEGREAIRRSNVERAHRRLRKGLEAWIARMGIGDMPRKATEK